MIILAAGVLAGVFLRGLSGGNSPAGGDKGTHVFESVCANCHGKDGAGNVELRSPSIAALPDWYVEAQLKKFQADIRGSTPEDVAGAQMRAIAHMLDDRAIAAVAAHVRALKKHPTQNTLGGVAERGRETYQIHCEQCHRPGAGGDYSFRSPPLTGLQDWYLAAQLEKFRTRVRGGHPHDLEGAKMRDPSARFLNEADEKDVLAYIARLAGSE